MKKTIRLEAKVTNKGRMNGIILGIPLDSTSLSRLLGLVELSLKKNQKFLIVTPNPEIILLAKKDEILRQVLQEAQFSLPDGIGLIWAGKFLGTASDLHLLKGREVLLSLFELANQKHLKVFLLGSTKEVIEKCRLQMQKEYPNAEVKSFEGPRLTTEAEPVSDSDIKFQSDALKMINIAKPDLLIVAFGAPKQEKWVYKNWDKLPVKGIMVVGGSLDYFAGIKKVPPLWMDTLNLEWLWRMLMEPGHWKRVYRAVIVFPIVVLIEKFKS